MRPIRVASTGGTNDYSRAFVTLSRWASRHVKKTSLCRQKSIPSEALIQRTHARQVATRDKIFKRHLPLSWLRFCIGLMSLALVFSDVLRSSVGVSDLRTIYPELQPDEAMNFGTSWNYSVFSATKSEAFSGELVAKVWSYKLDTTSVTWRAFAGFLNVSAFPDCLLYRTACPSEFLPGDVAFTMIDSLVNEVAQVGTSRKKVPATVVPVGLTVRSENEYIDRLHQLIFPTWFTNINWRTNQALYYSPQLLEKTNARSICFPANGNRIKTPRFCNELWTNLDRSCAPEDTASRSAGLLFVHTMERLHEIQTRFPNLTMDLTFLESQEDMQSCRGGLSSVGFRRSDVSAIIRARDCRHFNKGIPCKTIYVDDYRYETGLLISDVVQWYRIVSLLRMIGQGYFWLRGLALVLSCYSVFTTSKKKLAIWSHLRKAWFLFVKVPTQCVVFGSPFPVACYVLAHLLDAPFTYDVLDSQSFSQAGVLNFRLDLFIPFAVVQMRNVWTYALGWHFVVAIATSSWWTRGNQLNDGIMGVPEFLLSSFSSITLLAQYRSTAYRSAKILSLMEIPDNFGRAWIAVKYQYSFAHRGKGSQSLGGVIIDLKFLICFALLMASLWVFRTFVLRCWTYKRNEANASTSCMILLPPTPASYSAGILWPTVSLCVHWTSSFYCIRDENSQPPWPLKFARRNQYQHRLSFGSNVRQRQGDSRVIASNTNPERLKTVYRLTRLKVKTFRYIQHRMECLHWRSNSVEANVAFMNIVLMSDPLVFLQMMFGTSSSNDLGYYQSLHHPQQIVLLPIKVVGEHNEYTSGLKLLKRVKPSELTWSELVQCG